MKKLSLRYVALLVLALGVLFLIVWQFYLLPQMTKQSSIPAELENILMPGSKDIGPVDLLDHHGTVFNAERLKGKWSLLFFGYTHCPDVCPTALSKMGESLKVLEKQPGYAKDLQGIFISVDPARDSAEKLGSYVTYFHPDLIGATGEPKAIRKVASRLGASYRKQGSKSETDYEMYHFAGLFMINPQGQAVAILYPDLFSPEAMADKITRIRAHFNG